MAHKRIVLLPGDGIGPEVTREVRRVLEVVADVSSHRFEIDEFAVGGAALDAAGHPLPETTARAVLDSDSVFLGAVGGPAWKGVDPERSPEAGLLELRKRLGVFANLRPIFTYESLLQQSACRQEIAAKADFVIVRELTGGIYFGEKTLNDEIAQDICTYSRSEVERVTRVAMSLAKKRGRRVVSVDKANVLATSRLWRKTVSSLAESDYPEIHLEHALVDAAAFQMVIEPQRFDVVLCGNLFGDILSDLAAALPGSLGMLPSASIGENGPGLFEPVHGSAPAMAGKNICNPIGGILSAAMMLELGLGLYEEGQMVRQAVDAVVADGYLTADLSRDGARTTSEVGGRVAGVIARGRPASAVARSKVAGVSASSPVRSSQL